ERCSDLLAGYEIIIYSADPNVVIAAELFTQNTGVSTRIVPKNTSHGEILKMHGRSRISIGISIGDAISTSLLEAMVMGSFPIQSYTACVNEWVEHEVSGLVVPPEDPDVIEMAIRKALTDDDLVNKAADINWQVAKARLDSVFLKQKVADMYRIL
ncbi:MAG: glycosyltransferase, partial [Methanosarcinales archaeon]